MIWWPIIHEKTKYTDLTKAVIFTLHPSAPPLKHRFYFSLFSFAVIHNAAEAAAAIYLLQNPRPQMLTNDYAPCEVKGFSWQRPPAVQEEEVWPPAHGGSRSAVSRGPVLTEGLRTALVQLLWDVPCTGAWGGQASQTPPSPPPL